MAAPPAVCRPVSGRVREFRRNLPRAKACPGALSAESRNAGLGTAEDQRVDVVRALVSVDGLQIDQMADDVILVVDAVAAVYVAGEPGDIERLAAIVALEHRNRLRRAALFVLQAAEPQTGVQPQRDLGLHIDEFFLDQLVGGERAAELFAVERVIARLMPAELGGAERAPGNAVARVIEARKRPAQAAHA